MTAPRISLGNRPASLRQAERLLNTSSISSVSFSTMTGVPNDQTNIIGPYSLSYPERTSHGCRFRLTSRVTFPVRKTEDGPGIPPKVAARARTPTQTVFRAYSTRSHFLCLRDTHSEGFIFWQLSRECPTLKQFSRLWQIQDAPRGAISRQCKQLCRP